VKTSYRPDNNDTLDMFLDMFSVYRLDWLERNGFSPPGHLTQMGERIYFSETAFTQSVLVEFLVSVTHTDERDPSRSTYGMTWREPFLPWHSSLFSPVRAASTTALYLMGLYGLNLSNVHENGRALPYYASDAYREFLLFCSELNQLGVVSGEGADFTRIGWRINAGHMAAGDIDARVLAEDPEAKLLYTPPEIGRSGFQGLPGGERAVSRFS
jgi:hypothetical protein